MSEPVYRSEVAKKRIMDFRKPEWLMMIGDWLLWRLTYTGGSAFRRSYLRKFDKREDVAEYGRRLDMTPVPAFAKQAVNEIRNSIFQRMGDITRHGGSQAYQEAIKGLNGGVDRRGSTMDAFLGIRVLTELLVMGKAGIFVDSPTLRGETMKDAAGIRPYLYPYVIEDILSFACADPWEPNEFSSVLLRDTVMDYDGVTLLPVTVVERYRHLWIDQDNGHVCVQFYNDRGEEIDQNGGLGRDPIELQLTRIPFVFLDIGDSLLKDVAYHQVALMNLQSADIEYALKSNFPFYIEEGDNRGAGAHLKQSANPGTAMAGGQGEGETEYQVGTTQGRIYPKGSTNPPQFINPSDVPLRASMDLQANLKNEIRELVNLAVTDLGSRASAESKQLDNQGLEAGLAFIGLILESAERKVASLWAAYEQKSPARQQVATVKYPDNYSLKNDSTRLDEAAKLEKVGSVIPTQTGKKEIAKKIVQTLLGGRLPVEKLTAINREIDNSPYATSDPDVIIPAMQAGACGEETGSLALGFNKGEHLKAREDHSARIARIAEAQGVKMGQPNQAGEPQESQPGARGVQDLAADQDQGAEEKVESRDTTLSASLEEPVRGKGKKAG
jgi:hypothetical protein